MDVRVHPDRALPNLVQFSGSHHANEKEVRSPAVENEDSVDSNEHPLSGVGSVEESGIQKLVHKEPIRRRQSHLVQNLNEKPAAAPRE